jgi:hypothetical protein
MFMIHYKLRDKGGGPLEFPPFSLFLCIQKFIDGIYARRSTPILSRTHFRLFIY